MDGMGDLASLQLGLLLLGLHFGLGDRRQQQRGQDRDDADDHEQFDQGESPGSAECGVRSAESASAGAGISVVVHKRCHGYELAVVQ